MAATVLDSFVLELGIDTKNLSKGQRDALDQLSKFEQQATRTGKAIESQSNKITGLFNEAKRGLLLGFGAILTGFGAKELVDFVSNLDASTGRLAKTMGVGAAELSAWQGAIKQIGGSAESANSGLAGLSNEMTRFTLTGQSSILPVLSRLGVSLFDQNRNLKSAGALWLDLSDAVKGMDPRQAAAFLQMIPGANQDMINFALLGRKAMEQYIQSAREAGTTTADSAAEAQEYQKSLALLDQSAIGLGRTLVTWLTPALVGTMNVLKAMIKGLMTEPGSPEDVKLQSKFRNDIFKKVGSPGSFLRGLGLNSLADQFYGPEGADEANEAKRAGGASPGAGTPQRGWWTSDRQQHAVDRLMREGGLTEIVARSLVARMAGESPSGPGSVNPFSGAYGINQSLGSRKPGMMSAGGDFDAQLGVVIGELKGSESAAAQALNNARNSMEGAAAAGLYERAGPDEPKMQRDTISRFPNVPGASLAPGVVGGGKTSMNGGNNTTISGIQVSVNAPNAKDTPSAMHEVGPALERSLYAGAANFGQA